MSTVRVVSSHPESQGPFVILRAEDFDPAVHVLFEDPAPAEPVTASPAHPDEPSEPLPVPKRARRKE